MDSTRESRHLAAQTGLILLFLGAGFLVFLGAALATGITSALDLSLGQLAVIRGSQIAMLLASLVAALVLRNNPRLRPYWRLAFVYFVATCAVLLSDYTGDWALGLSGQALNTANGFAALKLGEDVAIIATILVLILLTRDRPSESYLATGRLRLGLAIGLSTFLVLSVLGLNARAVQEMPPGQLRQVLPAFVLIALADGLMEEMLFRGLFLKRLGRLLGDNWANVVTATVFAFAHLQVAQLTDFPVGLLMVDFLLGLLFGWIMQETKSVLAPALVHAGLIMLIIAESLATFGISG
jgi:membrane protease YdiL (CAAX protease family)